MNTAAGQDRNFNAVLSCGETSRTDESTNRLGLCFGLSFKATATETTLRYHERSYAQLLP